MAATVSRWSKPGAWALDAEEHEAELLQKKNDAPASDFPTLTTAIATGGGKSKKKKAQTLSLAEFTAYSGPKPSEPASEGLTNEDRMALPKGPRERTAEELDRSRLGGGFRSYGDRGGDRGNQPRGSDREREVRDSLPSRADEADNWGSMKKPSMSNGFERRDSRESRDRGGFFDSQSKADESSSWVTNKSFAPSPAADSRRFGGGRGGFTSNGGGADSDFWGKRREDSFAGSAASETGAARPRLNLQPRTLPVAAIVETAPVVASPVVVEAPVIVPKPRSVNPFGAARPREEVLAEKGQDWKKIDEQLDSMKIKEPSEKAEGGKRGFGSWRSAVAGERREASWRKSESADNGDVTASADADSTKSTEKNENDEPASEN